MCAQSDVHHTDSVWSCVNCSQMSKSLAENVILLTTGNFPVRNVLLGSIEQPTSSFSYTRSCRGSTPTAERMLAAMYWPRWEMPCPSYMWISRPKLCYIALYVVCCIKLCLTVWYCIISYMYMLHCNVLYYIALHCVLFVYACGNTVGGCNVFGCTALYCNVMWCIGIHLHIMPCVAWLPASSIFNFFCMLQLLACAMRALTKTAHQAH